MLFHQEVYLKRPEVLMKEIVTSRIILFANVLSFGFPYDTK